MQLVSCPHLTAGLAWSLLGSQIKTSAGLGLLKQHESQTKGRQNLRHPAYPKSTANYPKEGAGNPQNISRKLKVNESAKLASRRRVQRIVENSQSKAGACSEKKPPALAASSDVQSLIKAPLPPPKAQNEVQEPIHWPLMC